MSFIVIWLHFFLQAENGYGAPPKTPKTSPLMTLITLIYTDQKVQTRADYKLLNVSGFFLAAGGVFFSGMVSSMMIFFTP
jgi:hypothetical protein